MSAILTRDDMNVDKENTAQAYLMVDDTYHKVFHEIQLLFLVDFLYDFSVQLNPYDIFQLLPPPKNQHSSNVFPSTRQRFEIHLLVSLNRIPFGTLARSTPARTTDWDHSQRPDNSILATVTVVFLGL